ncbi:hypothetical protein POTOM_008033 [Populus tomentosa]|uniref:Uncharacterized protein n=1 Tax=Populus tomentosa TaxID=118781 RepID=A0A8X8AGP7_POPTO|nr:hypothetical protein POTOM_008033 [Populus tomentosa]
MEKIRVAVRVRPAVTVSEDTTINGTCWKKIASLFTILMALLSPASLMPSILSDAASLKRQKLEIEEQRKKLQGSRAEVLEQEILKLRNDMLKCELEREKLEMELEEERKSHKERDQCIKEEQMKTGNLNTRATSSDRWSKSSSTWNMILVLPSSNIHPYLLSVTQSNLPWKHLKDAEKYSYANQRPGTECWETEPRGIQWQQHCLPRRCFWNPYLDSIQMTPAREVQSFPSSDATPIIIVVPSSHITLRSHPKLTRPNLFQGYSPENYKVEVQNLKRQLDLALEEKNEVEACLQFCFRHFSIFNFMNRLMIQ